MATKVITGKVRFSFVNVYEPKEPQGGGDAKYSVTLLIPKTDTATLNKIKAAMAEARENFCKRNGANALPPKPVNTLHDGDGMKDNGEEYGPECNGNYVISVSSKQKPVLVDEFGNETNDPNCIYSGCYGRAAINFYGYSRQGKKGISAGLLSLKKLHDGDPFGVVGSAADFDDDWMDDDADDLLD
jgi:hypothetical protein